MRKGVPKLYYLIPVIYLGLTGAFLYLHFTQTESHTEQIGYISLSVKSKRGSTRDMDRILGISVAMNGFSISISDESPVWLYDNSIPFKAEIKGFRTFPDGLEITLSGDLQLRFISGSSESSGFTIVPVFTGTNNNVSSVSLPVRYPKETSVSRPGTLSVTAFTIPGSTGAATFFLSLPKQGRYDEAEASIIIPGKVPKGFEIVYERAPEGISDPFVYWFMKARKILTENEFRIAVRAFTEKAMAGWERDRFQPAAGGWTNREGRVEYQESLAAAYLSESLERNTFKRAQAQVRSALGIRGQRPLFLSSPYLGNLRGSVEIQQEEDIRRLERITNLLKKRDPSLFLEEGIIQFIVDRGPYSLLKDLYAFAETTFAENRDRAVRIGLFSAYLEGLMIDPEIGSNLSFAEAIPHTDIFPNIVGAGTGLYLLGSDDTVSVIESVRVGRLLMRMADIRKNALHREIGMDLIVSATALADNQGFVPRMLSVADGKITKKTGQIAPEDLYPLVVSEARYPHQVSLYSSLSPGSWIWTAGQISYMKMEKEEYRIGIRYPADEVHHIIFQGIKPFQTLRLYGIPWKMDPAFEAYPAGWVYIRETETLLIKLRQRSEEEELVIVFGNVRDEEPQPSGTQPFPAATPAYPGSPAGGTASTPAAAAPASASTGTQPRISAPASSTQTGQASAATAPAAAPSAAAATPATTETSAASAPPASSGAPAAAAIPSSSATPAETMIQPQSTAPETVAAPATTPPAATSTTTPTTTTPEPAMVTPQVRRRNPQTFEGGGN